MNVREPSLPTTLLHLADPANPATAHPERVSLGYLVNLIARLLAQSLRARNGADGILPGQFPVVLELLNQDGLTQRQLCDFIKVEQGTMASTLKRMERDGLIRRRPCANDGRQATIHLTARGRELSHLAVDNAMAVNEAAVAGLDEASRAELRRLMLHMARNLQTDLADRASRG